MSIAFKDYAVSRDASADDIKKAFRKLARKHHPDVAKDKSTAQEKIREINEAYEALGDPEKRSKHDQIGADGSSFEGGARSAPGARGDGAGQEFHFGGTGFGDFFEQ